MGILKLIALACFIGFSVVECENPGEPVIDDTHTESNTTTSEKPVFDESTTSNETTLSSEESTASNETTLSSEESTASNETTLSSEESTTSNETTSTSSTTVTNTVNGTETVSNGTETSVNETSTEVDTDDIIITDKGITDSSNITNNYTEVTTTEVTDQGNVTTSDAVESECDYRPCKNGGTCLEGSSSNSTSFTCLCDVGFTGLLCGVEYTCEKNEDGELCKGGACMYSEDGKSRRCDCLGAIWNSYWDEGTKQCKGKKLPCFPNPCENGGICQETKNNSGDFQCHCLQGFEGDTCSDDCGDCVDGECQLDETLKVKTCKCHSKFFWSKEERKCLAASPPCLPNPCKNSGECSELEEGKFNCTCKGGFSGSLCDVKEFCSGNADCGSGTCKLNQKDQTKMCECDERHYLDENTHKCREIKAPCHPSPCLNDGVCTALTSSDYNCTCSNGYTGQKCETRDYCLTNGGKMFCKDAECKNGEELKSILCECKEGQSFDYFKRECADVNLCSLIECGPFEECVSGTCHCMENFKRNNITKTCEADFCSSDPCPSPDMSCTDNIAEGNFSCSCKEGHLLIERSCVASFCSFPNLNDCEQLCDVKDNGYSCSCHPGFKLAEDNKTCINVQNGTCTNRTCDGGWCVLDEGSEVCFCPSAFIEVNGKCTDFCSAGKLPAGLCPTNECEPVPDKGFRCLCTGKYELAEDGVTCAEKDMCAKKEAGRITCDSKYAECVEARNTTEGFVCLCKEGDEETEGGLCVGACSLDENMVRCSEHGAVCGFEHGHRTCRCPPLFQYNDENNLCNKPADVSYLFTFPLDSSSYQTQNGFDYTKANEDVTYAMEKMLPGFQRSSLLKCRTNDEYSVCKFEFLFDYAREMDLRRMKSAEICLAGNQTADKCLVPPSLILRKSKLNDLVSYAVTDPCDSDITLCGSDTECKASDDKKAFKCSCNGGFSVKKKEFPYGDVNTIVELCQDIDECSADNACVENSECTNTIGSYYCRCKSGFRSVKDPSKGMQCLEICNPSPCANGKCKVRGDHGFECDCDRGYRGSFCDLKDEYLKGAKVNTIVVGVVLGGILLIVCILFFACMTRLRKQKMYDNTSIELYNSAEMTERRRVGGPAVNNAFQKE